MIFPDFSIPLIIFQTFQGLENFNFKFHDFPNYSRICTNPDMHSPFKGLETHKCNAGIFSGALEHLWPDPSFLENLLLNRNWIRITQVRTYCRHYSTATAVAKKMITRLSACRNSYLVARKTVLRLLRGKAAATLQCMYISSVLHDDVLVHGVDEPPEFFLNDRRRHQLNTIMTSISRCTSTVASIKEQPAMSCNRELLLFPRGLEGTSANCCIGIFKTPHSWWQ